MDILNTINRSKATRTAAVRTMFAPLTGSPSTKENAIMALVKERLATGQKAPSLLGRMVKAKMIAKELTR